MKTLEQFVKSDDLNAIIKLIIHDDKKYDLSNHIDEIIDNDDGLLAYNILTNINLSDVGLTAYADELYAIYKSYKIDVGLMYETSIFEQNLHFMSINSIIDNIQTFHVEMYNDELEYMYSNFLSSTNELISKLKSKNSIDKLILLDLDEEYLLTRYDKLIHNYNVFSFVIQLLWINNMYDEIRLAIEINKHHINDLANSIKCDIIPHNIVAFHVDLQDLCVQEYINIMKI